MYGVIRKSCQKPTLLYNSQNQFFCIRNGFSPKTFTTRICLGLEMLIYLTDPKYPEVCVINNPCSCYIDTCSKKIQSEIVIH